jgi:hypothetical protein
MSRDALTRKWETVAQFNGVATGFDSEGTFAHFGRRLVWTRPRLNAYARP